MRIRLSRTVEAAPDLAGRVVVVLNHPSWWDPFMGMVLSECLPIGTMFPSTRPR